MEVKSGVHYELVDALEKADAEIIKVYASVIQNEASEGKGLPKPKKFASLTADRS